MCQLLGTQNLSLPIKSKNQKKLCPKSFATQHRRPTTIKAPWGGRALKKDQMTQEFTNWKGLEQFCMLLPSLLIPQIEKNRLSFLGSDCVSKPSIVFISLILYKIVIFLPRYCSSREVAKAVCINVFSQSGRMVSSLDPFTLHWKIQKSRNTLGGGCVAWVLETECTMYIFY